MTVEARIEGLSLRGEGLAGGLTVPRALPGEAVRGTAADGRMAAPEILDRSPHRVEPPCPHFAPAGGTGCGGCSLMHASDRFVAAWKVGVVRKALAARGLTAEVAGIATSPPASRRRAVLSGRRTKGGAIVGFHARASDAVVPIPHCRVLTPALVGLLPACEALVAAGASRRGALSLTVTEAAPGADVAVTGGGMPDAAAIAELAGIAAAHGIARLTWEGETAAMAAAPAQSFGGVRVVPPPGAFLQATRQGEAALRAVVMAALPEEPAVDLFAGCGTFALPVAAARPVHAVEGDPAMVAALLAGARGAAGLRAVTAEARDLFRRPLGGAELAPFGSAILDPPRAGAEAQVAALAADGPPVIAHVSCNPVTFARDAATLVAGGYRMGPVHVVDQFRWSAHVELVAAFRR